jgi:Uma2 family endonuclease
MAGRAARKQSAHDNFSYNDYLSWTGPERWELVDGNAYAMSPGPDADHQRISRDLCTQINIFLKGKKCELFQAPFDLLLPEGDEADEKVKTVLQPDAFVVCEPEKITGRGCRGAPEWVIEILSPSTAGRDQILKKRVYENAGVKEYWICSPHERIIFVYLLHKNRLTLSEVYDETAKIEVKTLPGLAIDCGEIFPPRPPVEVREPPVVYI